MKRLILAQTVVSLALLTLPGTLRMAQACHPPTCMGDNLLPVGGYVPLNAPGLLYYPHRKYFDSSPDTEIELRELTGVSTYTLVPLTKTKLPTGGLLLSVQGGLQLNKIYELWAADGCTGSGKIDGTAKKHALKATPSAPLPKSLGTLTARPQQVSTLTVATASGSCSADITAAHARVELEPSAEVKPWLGLLSFSTEVDGKPWAPGRSLAEALTPGQSWRGRGVDEIYAICKSQDSGVLKGVGEGTHSVVIKATLPGGKVALATPPLPLTLTCSGLLPDGGYPSPDGGYIGLEPCADEPFPPWDLEDPQDPASGRGCSCSAAGGGAPSAWWLLLAGVLLAVRRRRRR